MYPRHLLFSLLALVVALVGLAASTWVRPSVQADASVAAGWSGLQPANPALRQLDGPTSAFANPAPIAIPQLGAATTYPSSITVTGVSGAITHLAVRLNGLSHTYPRDIDIKLVAPDGRRVLLMSDAGPAQGDTGLVNATLTLDDAGPALPCEANLTSGVYRPTNCPDDLGGSDNFPAPAPPSVTGDSLSHFIGLNPNGVWSLYVQDDSPGDAGVVQGGWALDLTLGCAPAVFSGQVRLQGRTNYSGVQVGPVTTGPNGRFEFTVQAPRTYTLRAFHPKYLPAQVTVYDACGPASLPTVTLLGGDTDSDGQIGISDLVRLGLNYGTDPASDPLADIDDNGRVDIGDLTMVGSNYGLDQSPWVLPTPTEGQR